MDKIFFWFQPEIFKNLTNNFYCRKKLRAHHVEFMRTVDSTGKLVAGEKGDMSGHEYDIPRRIYSSPRYFLQFYDGFTFKM